MLKMKGVISTSSGTAHPGNRFSQLSNINIFPKTNAINSQVLRIFLQLFVFIVYIQS